jgi:uncharacterized membrane protein (UPF0127 family)
MLRTGILLAGLLTLVMACGPDGSEPFGVAQLTLRGPEGQAVNVPVYVAATPQQRQRGLMGRTHLPAGTGMAFVYSQPVRVPFFMKNTLIPLEIAFYDERGRVVRVLDMEPCTTEPCPLYDAGTTFVGALEVNRGFFRQIGLREGWIVDSPKGLPTSER